MAASSTRSLLSASLLALALALATPAIAHNLDADAPNWWLAWSFDLDLMLPLALAVFIYTRGRSQRSERAIGVAEPLLFGLGLLVLYLSLQSPIDPLGERNFTMHQLQHLLLRSLAPMLLFLPSPQATLVAGLPSSARRALARLSRVTALRAFFGVLLHPVSVTLLFIASAYVWQYPPYVEAALLDDGFHYLMHVTMLIAGIVFWWRIFDDRPSSMSYGARVVMLWAVTAANIALGAYLTLKGYVLYPIYDEVGRLWISGELDELLGGILVWIPGSMMGLIGLLAVIRRWGRGEERAYRRLRPVASQGGAAVAAAAHASASRSAARLAVMLGLLSGGIFVGFIGLIALNLLG
jgi:putative membrane protein